MKYPFNLTIDIKGNSKSSIKRRLEKIIKEFDTPYGKPVQGTIIESGVETKIITSVWNGKEY